MKPFFLVHGGWAGRHVWEPLINVLAANGYSATAIDLPAHGDDPTPISGASLDGYAQAVLNHLPDVPIVLVGHSMGGIVISRVAELAPERVDQLVYIAAYLPQSGETMVGLSQQDTGSQISENMELAADFASGTIRTDVLADILCHDGPVAIRQLLLDTHRPEPVAPLMTPVELTAERFGNVPVYYFETLDDHAVGLSLQRQMVARHGSVKAVLSLPTSHYAFLTKPELVAELLAQVAAV